MTGPDEETGRAVGTRPAVRVAVALAVVVSVGLVVESRWGALPDVDWRLRPGWLALAALALVAFQTLHAELWTGMTRALGGPLARPRGRAIWNVTLLGRYVPTGALMAVGRVDMAERAGVPKRVCAASIVYELGLQVASAAAVGAYFVVTLPQLEDRWWRHLAFAVPVVGLACLHPAAFGRLAGAALRRLGREPLPVTLGMGAVLRYAAGYAASFGVAGLAVLAVARGVQPVGLGDAPTLVGSYSVGFVAGMLGFLLPGGIGPREAALAAALSPVLAVAPAIVVAILVRLVQIAVEVVYAPLSVGAWRRSEGPAAGPL